jgi:hypothetical protein
VPERGRPGPGLVATELVLGRTLGVGERHDVSFLVSYEPRAGSAPVRPADPVLRQLVTRPLESLDLCLSFDPAAVPGAVLACRWRARDGAEVARRELTVPGCRSYELLVADPAPGGYGWRWAAAGSGRRGRARARPDARSSSRSAAGAQLTHSVRPVPAQRRGGGSQRTTDLGG